MATGDILSATAHRWYIELLIEGLSSGGTYDTGYGADLDPSDAKIVLTRTNETFGATANVTTKQTTLYVTKVKRQDVPNQTTPDETISGSNVIVRLALSDEVYSGDTSITVSIDAGLYSQGGNDSNAVTDLAVTNSSTRAYYPSIANFSRIFHGRVMGFDDINIAEISTNFEIRAFAYHRDGKVPVIKVTATGQTSAHVETIYLTEDEIDKDTYNDYYGVPERIGNIPISGFTQGELVDLDLFAYPNIGDATAVRSSTTSGYSMPTDALATQTVICDKNHTYGVTVAVIDSVSGNDGTGAVVDFSSFVPGSPPNAFLTIGAAATAIRAYNLANHTRDDHGGGVFFLQAGNYALTGVATTGTAADAFIIITPFPGVATSSVSITSQDDWIADKVKYHKLTINFSASTIYTDPSTTVPWWSECDVQDFPATFQYPSPSVAVFTGCEITDPSARFRYAGGPISYLLIGNYIHGQTGIVYIMSRFVRGNRIDGQVNISDGYASGPLKGCIIDYNLLKRTTDGGAVITLGNNITGDNTEGYAVVNNIMEKPTAGSSNLFNIAADGTLQYTVNNVIVWNNVVVGQRSNLAYNDYTLEGVGPAPREGWSIKGNFFDDFNIVTDTSTHGGSPSADKNGNLSIVHGCGIASNWYGDNTVGGYMPEFIGLKSVEDVGGDPGFVDYAGAYGTGLGDGDYHLESDSPGIDMMVENFLTHDLDGNTRNEPDEAGAYRYFSGTRGNKTGGLTSLERLIS